METKPVTIELRNKDAYRGNPNLELTPGDWTTTLSDQLVLNNGDSIFVKQSFIDTEASSSREVNIPEDITLHLEHAYYLKTFPYWLDDTYQYDNRVVNGVSSVENEAIIKLACDQFTEDTAPAGYGLIKKLGWQVQDPKKVKTFTWSLQVTGLDGSIVNTEPKQIFSKQPSSQGLVEVDVNIPYKISEPVVFTTYKGAINSASQAELGVVPPAVNKLLNNTDFDELEYAYYITALLLTNRHFTLKQDTTDIKIPAGNYDPTDLCTIINRKLNDRGKPVDLNFVQTNFLKTSGSSTYPTQGATVFIANNPPDEVTDGIGIYQYNRIKRAGGTVYETFKGLYGASKLLLDFNVGQGLFSFTYMHTPYYYQGAESTSNQGIGNNGYLLNKTGGIIFTSLTATSDKFGSRVSFWDEKLGFDIDATSPNSIVKTSTVVDAVNGIVVPRINGLEDGVNITGNFTGADSLILKETSMTNASFMQTSNTFSGDYPGLYNASTYTLPVLAQQPIFQQNTSFGYYLLEIDTNFESQFLDTSSTNKKIKSVVSRFFERASYTAGTSDGSLIYTHVGEPQLLSSFTCRILTSDKTLATNVGVDNTIFLQLQRAMPAIEAPKSKDSRA